MAKKRKQRRRVTEQLRRSIRDCGLTQYELAKRIGVPQSALCRFMSGERGLSMHVLDALGKLLDLEVVMHGPKE